MQEGSERQRQVSMLLRQLSAGLSSYRLFPGEIEQSAFVASVERIQEAARTPLASGPVAIEVRGRTFAIAEGPLPEDETTFRLAVACYERRVEHVLLRSMPSAADLAAVYEALTRSVDEVAAAGGVDSLLRQAGVTSMALTAIEPQAIDTLVDPAALPPEHAELWGQLQHGGAPSLDELGGGVSEAAADIYSRFRDLVAALPASAAQDPELYRRLHRAVTTLPGQVRRDLVGILVDEASSQDVAERLVGSVTDHQLGELLVELGEDGTHDPVQMAKDLVDRHARQAGLVELVRELAGQRGRLTGAVQPATPRVETDTAKVAIGEIVGEGPLRMEEARSVRMEFPDTSDGMRTQALATLHDYLVAEEDADRLTRVLDLWVQEVRSSMVDGGNEATALVELATSAGARSPGDDARRAVFDGFRRKILDIPFLQRVLGQDVQADSDRIVSLLAPLGDAAVEGLLDVLGDETDRARRSTLVSILAQLAGTNPGPVQARLGDERWYMVRNAVNILHKAKGGRERVALLESAAAHAHAAVRREVIWGLVSVLGADAASHMARFVNDPDSTVRERAVSFLGSLDSAQAADVLVGVARSSDDPSLRRRALEELSHNPSSHAARVLRELALFRSRPRLPWSLRRLARKLLRKRST